MREQNHAPIIELLLIAGADPAPAVRGKTAYALCTEKAPRNALGWQTQTSNF